MTTRIVIDCDTGMDDAIAIALAAAAAPTLSLAAITTVAGNAPIGVTTANTLATVAALGIDVPVLPGNEAPAGSSQRYGTVLWGGDGGLGLPPVAARTRDHAVDFLTSHLAAAAPASATLCPIGPLTNIAAAFDREADLADRIARLVIMGGAFEGGNVTEHAEFNIWFDPPAAARVFDAPCHAVLVPYDLTRHIVVGPERIARLAKAATPAAQVAAKLLPLAGSDNHPSSIHDAATIGWLLWPELFDSEIGTVSVACREDAEYGRTLFEADPDGRHRVLTAIDRDAFLDRMMATLAGAGG